VLELLDGLISRPSFEQLRAGDRRQFHEFHERVSAWLAQPVDERAGLYLWQDFAGFVQMLRAVNHRQELVELTRVAAALA
jgi:hypothetical protein